jgi:hypothetical protein
MARGRTRILLVDDGELDEVAGLLSTRGLAYERLRGSQIDEPVAPPLELLVVTPRHIERVRRGSPPQAAPERPLRVVVTSEDSSALRRHLRRAGFHLLVRQDAEGEIWRLLVARAGYHGSERRHARRVAVGAPVDVSDGVEPASEGDAAKGASLLIDLSNRGCRVRTTRPVSIGDPIELTIHLAGLDGLSEKEPLALRGRIRRLAHDPKADERTLAIVFDSDLEDASRSRLTALINHWAAGPSGTKAYPSASVPAIPPCRLPSLPDLMLDDETDPPVTAGSELSIELGEPSRPGSQGAQPPDRRRRARGRFETSFLAEAATGPRVLIGRDLSAAGMRIERIDGLETGDRFQLALHGPGSVEPLLVEAEVARDDGPAGLALVFCDLEPKSRAALEKLAGCLPDVGSLEERDCDGLAGAILSELVGA